MTVRDHHAEVDVHGHRAGRAAAGLASETDTWAMLERVRRTPRSSRWTGPVIAVAAATAAIAIGLAVTWRVPTSGPGADVAGNPPGDVAPRGLTTADWPPERGTGGPLGWVEVPREVLPTGADVQDLVVHDGAFVLAIEGGGVWTSGDGFAWRQVGTLPVSIGQRVRLASDGSALIAVASTERDLWVGDLSGFRHHRRAPGGISDVAAGGGSAVLAVTVEGEPQLLASEDGGLTWERVPGPGGNVSIAWDGDGYVAATSGPRTHVATTADPFGEWSPMEPLPDGHWALVEAEPGVVAVPRADGEQPALDPLMFREGDGWSGSPLPGAGPFVVDDITTLDDGSHAVMAEDTSKPDGDADGLYRLDLDDAPSRVRLETAAAFGATSVLRLSFAVTHDGMSMVAFSDAHGGVTVWVHRSPTPREQTDPRTEVAEPLQAPG